MARGGDVEQNIPGDEIMQFNSAKDTVAAIGEGSIAVAGNYITFLSISVLWIFTPMISHLLIQIMLNGYQSHYVSSFIIVIPISFCIERLSSNNRSDST